MEDKVQEINKQSGNMPKRPILTTIASIVWIIFGSFNILGIIVLLTSSVSTNSNNMGLGGSLFNLFLIAIPAILGIVFTYVGVQTLRGKARDVIISSIFSILIGIFYLPATIQMSGRVNSATFFLAGLVVAGILALIGRSRYKAWRNARIKQADDSKVVEKLEE